MSDRLTFLSLFAGIGGIDLGLERAGMWCVGQVEINPFCRAALAKHWPHVPRFEDVRTVTRDNFTERIDCIAGGFPCQDISLCGKRAGIGGERSGLWSEFCRLIREIRPRYVLVENVTALLVSERDTGGQIRPAPIARVLGDLAACGFDAEWDCLPASAFGAYHERDRVFVLAYPARVDGKYCVVQGGEWGPQLQSRRLRGLDLAERGKRPHARLQHEPDVARMVRNVPGAVDRIAAIGNSVCPAVAEWIGCHIVRHASQI